MENDQAGYDMDEMRERFDRIRNRHTNGTAPRAVSTYQLFQTPEDTAQRLVSMLDLQPGARVLEPSAGLGRIIDALAGRKPREIVAVEQSADCARELFNRDQSALVIKQGDFLSLDPDDIGLFDAIAMNPPFHMRSDIRHIEHAKKFLRPGGKLAAICMNTTHRRKAFGDSQWIDLPPATFRQEGTNTPTAIIVWTK